MTALKASRPSGFLLAERPCAACAAEAGVAGAWVDRGAEGVELVLAPGTDEAAARARLSALDPCDCAAADARQTRLRAVGLDERTAALALVLAQGEKAPADARALVADLAERAAKAWGS